MRTIVFFFLFLGCLGIQAQNRVDDIIDQIQMNNSTIQALQAQLNARRIENKTGIFLHNPEFEYAYFWGSPEAIGPKKNLSLRQSFAFPSVYTYQNRISNARNEQLSLELAQLRTDIRFEARLSVYDLIYINACLREMELRYRHAGDLAAAFKKMQELGEASRLDYNKTSINLASIEQQMAHLITEKEAILANLKRLNGGHSVGLEQTVFDLQPLPADFDLWYQETSQQNPYILWLEQEMEIGKKHIGLSRAKSLPGFSAGYVSEALTHEQFRGWVVGVSIPLWENKNTVSLSRARVVALEETTRDNQLQFYNQLKSSFIKASSLQQAVNTFRQNLQGSDHSALLEKAWRSGEISLITYLQELSYYYDSVDRLLDAERELSKAFAQLYRYTL